jgi:hypothetical protein
MRNVDVDLMCKHVSLGERTKIVERGAASMTGSDVARMKLDGGGNVD